MFDLCEEMNECRQNYYEHILRMPIDRIPRRYVIITQKEEGREADHLKRWRDEFA
jgi:hypothetical protein